MEEDVRTGGEPTHFALCTDCGRAYAAQLKTENKSRPVGLHGECQCGNDEFVPLNQ